MCQGARAIAVGKLAKKFAPEIELPAQKNQMCSLNVYG
jgi:hypothetical protein